MGTGSTPAEQAHDITETISNHVWQTQIEGFSETECLNTNLYCFEGLGNRKEQAFGVLPECPKPLRF